MRDFLKAAKEVFGNGDWGLGIDGGPPVMVMAIMCGGATAISVKQGYELAALEHSEKAVSFMHAFFLTNGPIFVVPAIIFAAIPITSFVHNLIEIRRDRMQPQIPGPNAPATRPKLRLVHSVHTIEK